MNKIDELISATGWRKFTFDIAIGLIKSKTAVMGRPPSVIIETGTSRKISPDGDGNGTFIFAEYARQVDGIFYSIDINQANVDFATKEIEARGLQDYATIVCSDSVAFLKRWPLPIDVLYLDSWDYVPSDPEPSQIHNLNEFKAAEPLLHEHSIIILDDAHGTLKAPGGKVGMTVPYLLANGYRCAAYTGHQGVFCK